MKDKETIMKALSVCAEFECDRCPYQYLDHEEYKLRCIHALIMDLNEILKED